MTRHSGCVRRGNRPLRPRIPSAPSSGRPIGRRWPVSERGAIALDGAPGIAGNRDRSRASEGRSHPPRAEGPYGPRVATRGTGGTERARPRSMAKNNLERGDFDVLVRARYERLGRCPDGHSDGAAYRTDHGCRRRDHPHGVGLTAVLGNFFSAGNECRAAARGPLRAWGARRRGVPPPPAHLAHRISSALTRPPAPATHNGRGRSAESSSDRSRATITGPQIAAISLGASTPNASSGVRSPGSQRAIRHYVLYRAERRAG